MNRQDRLRTLLREYIESLFVAVLIALILRFFVIGAYKIPTPTMWPSLLAGDFVFAYKLPYGLRFPFGATKYFAYGKPEHGDIVVFHYDVAPTTPHIKRVIGIPGDEVAIHNKKLWINGQESQYEVIKSEGEFTWVKEEFKGFQHELIWMDRVPGQDFGPEVVPPGHVFLLGDHRDVSEDSRYWGMLPIANIEGHVFLIWLSLDWQDPMMGLPQPRWERIFKLL